MAVTGAFWNVDDPLKPFGLFDPDGVYDLPFIWTDWIAALAGVSDSYASHTIVCQTGLECVQSQQAAGVITARIRKAVAETLIVGRKYSVTCHIITTNGQREDQTLWLKVIEK